MRIVIYPAPASNIEAMKSKKSLQTLFDIISIGYELLDGRILNTNAKYLAEQINALGGKVCRIITVGDDVDEISAAIKDSLRRKVDWIITSGGLGPTYDDVTLQGVAKALRRKLVLSKKAVEMLKERYRELAEKGVVESAELTPHRMKMAMLPKGAKPLENEVGAAPGVLLKVGKTRIVCLPGVPKELENIFEKKVKPLLQKHIKKVYFADRWINIEDVPESTLAPEIDKIREKYPEVYIKSHPERRDEKSFIRLYLKTLAKTREKCEKILDSVEKEVAEAVKRLGGRTLRMEEEE